MTDNRMADLLALFREIEVLMVQNGAKEIKENGRYTTYKEKISGFDTFDFEPKNPGNVGYKFYVEENKYYVKEAYRYDVNIKEQLQVYENYKLHEIRYKEYRETILGSNYYVLQHIGYERNKLLYIENYEIEDHKAFVKDCKSMIKYLKNPDKKRFLSYSKLSDGAINKFVTLKEKSIFSQSNAGVWIKGIFYIGLLIAAIFLIKYISEQEVSSLSDPTMGHYIWGSIFGAIALYILYETFTFFTNKWVLRSILFIASLFGLNYLRENEYLPAYATNHTFTITEYLWGGALLALFAYLLPSMILFFFRTLSSIFIGLNNFISEFFTGVLSLLFGKNSMVAIGFLALISYLLLYGKDIRERVLDKNIGIKCQYYYVQVDILHVRTDATDRSRITDKVYKDEKLCITQKKPHWFYIYHKGWVYSQYITKKD